MLRLPTNLILNEKVLVSAARAAQVLGTLMLIRPEDYTNALLPYAENLIPCLTRNNYEDHIDLIHKSRAVELEYSSDIDKAFVKIRALKPEIIIMVGIPLDARSADRAVQLVHTGVDTLHYSADENGQELNTKNPRFIKEMIREVHLKLVDDSTRQKINLVFSGGIAMAEHMAKAIICGADGVVVDNQLLVALECRLCYRCREGLSCPVKIDEDIDPDWGSQRIVNLMGAWHSQLIEVMGAMGIREARRLRGEVGRSMWFEDLEMENFGPIFGKRKVSGLG
jgi:NAD(P)H-dependent flavin oxidoreductase YrpB (nitropropane dioxygenase family)